MKLLDLINEEPNDLSDNNRKSAKLVYKALQTGVYRPYPDSNKLKYILPDFEDKMIFLKKYPIILLDFSKVKMYIITSGGELVDVRRIGSDDSAVIKNIKSRITNKFKQHNIPVMEL